MRAEAGAGVRAERQEGPGAMGAASGEQQATEAGAAKLWAGTLERAQGHDSASSDK